MSVASISNTIHSPADLKKLDYRVLKQLRAMFDLDAEGIARRHEEISR